VNLGPTINSSSKDSGPSISVDGLSLFFDSVLPGGYGDTDIWVSTRPTLSDPWGEPVNLGPIVNGSYRDSAPSISHDGLELYFGDIGVGPFRPGGYGGGDLWVTTRATTEDEWSTPVNLGPTVNSSSFDASPNISGDGLALFFYSRRGGGYGYLDIWLSRRTTTDDPWGIPVNLGPPVNTSNDDVHPSISADGSTLYFASTRHGGSGRSDLYKASIDPIVDLNGDGIVDAVDICIMVDFWGTDEPLCDIGPMPWGDGVVDIQDLIVLAEHLFEGLGDNVWEGRISIATDDEEEYADTARYDPSSSDLEMPYEREGKGDPQIIGLRFSDVRVPKGANVVNAYIEFVCDETKGGTEFVSLLIEGELSPDAAAISTAANYNISSRSRTAANAVWEPVDWTAAGQADQTSNIASVIEEIVNQDGWASGNALVIIIGDNTDNPSEGLRCAESYDGSPSAAPLLNIEFAVP
jgi:hypothetical protein